MSADEIKAMLADPVFRKMRNVAVGSLVAGTCCLIAWAAGAFNPVIGIAAFGFCIGGALYANRAIR